MSQLSGLYEGMAVIMILFFAKYSMLGTLTICSDTAPMV